jgi:hypothetical protein
VKQLQAVYHFDVQKNECRDEPPLRVCLVESGYLASRGITRDNIAGTCIILKRPVSMLNIQGVPGGKDLTRGECSLGQTLPI